VTGILQRSPLKECEKWGSAEMIMAAGSLGPPSAVVHDLERGMLGGEGEEEGGIRQREGWGSAEMIMTAGSLGPPSAVVQDLERGMLGGKKRERGEEWVQLKWSGRRPPWFLLRLWS
jgi:hypothetical protein